MSVPLLDLQAQYRPLRSAIEAAIREVCDSQQFIGGEQIALLERRIASYSQAKYGIGVSSGTDALLLALMTLGIGRGDEVITSAYSFFATAGVIARLGARPIFCDIDPDSYNLDPDAVAQFLRAQCRIDKGVVVNRKTGGAVKALMPVHLFGQTADMQKLCILAEEFGLKTVEDAAQAIGAEDANGRRAGSVGDMGCFSFFPSKNLGAFGDAGMCVTQSEELASRARVLRLHGANPKYHHSMIGGNFRLDALQAAVLNVKLGYLDAWTRARQENAARYDELLGALGVALKTPVRTPGCRHIYNQYVVEVKGRERLRGFLREKRIATEVYYPIPLHLQECFRYLGYGRGDCPNAEHAAAHSLALPVYPELPPEHQRYVVEQIAAFFAASDH